MSRILLTTLNARYSHCSLALRYLKANLGNLAGETALLEFTIHENPQQIAERLLQENPEIIGFSIYLWNVSETQAVVSTLRLIAPEVKLVAGGPEVSFANDLPPIAEQLDHIITGPGEISFAELCRQILSGRPVLDQVIVGQAVKPDDLQLPYELYAEEDVSNRIVYVEASRGCPFKCEFCLSALDKTATAFDLSAFLAEMEKLLSRGVRHFKFIDRTFNLKTATTLAILDFFLQRIDKQELFLHFEMIPDHLPEALKEMLPGFPAGSLQFEVGIQTFDPEVQQLISRKQNNEASEANLRWLLENTRVHIHADLIFGLPGETLASFAESFDRLVAIGPQEIQLGILKRLRGAPIIRHEKNFDLRFNPQPPYNVLSTRDVDFATMQRINRFARFWDLIANSGKFNHSLPLILGDAPFDRFLLLSDRLFAAEGRSWKIALRRLFALLHEALPESGLLDEQQTAENLWLDFKASGERGHYLKQGPVAEREGKTRIGRRQKAHRNKAGPVNEINQGLQ